jgi:hypothetical protein
MVFSFTQGLGVLSAPVKAHGSFDPTAEETLFYPRLVGG